MNINDYMIHF